MKAFPHIPGRRRILPWPVLLAALLAAAWVVAGEPAAGPPSHARVGGVATGVAPTADAGLAANRGQAWRLVERIASAPLSITDAARSGWHTDDEVFPPAPVPGAVGGSRRGAMQRGDEELILFTLYDDTAMRHVQAKRLNDRDELERLRRTLVARRAEPAGVAAAVFPTFPPGSVILLTGWWPVARDGLTALPVWDPADNPPNPRGNGYLTWKRAVALDAGPAGDRREVVDVSFVGRRMQAARRVPLESLLHVRVDEAMARRLAGDERTRKAMIIALGRPLRPGDSLALVALHVVGKQADGWTWTTLWWHDAPDAGPFADGRPADLRGPLRNYLLDVTYESPTVAGEVVVRDCFNPWLEAKFPDGGSGGGVSSNCIACHRRASYPAASFLPIRRSMTPSPDDPAMDPSRLRTDFIWSIARRAGQP